MSKIEAEAQNGTGTQANTDGSNAGGQNQAPDVENISSLSDYRALAARVRVTDQPVEQPKPKTEVTTTETVTGGDEAPAGDGAAAGGEGEGNDTGTQGSEGDEGAGEQGQGEGADNGDGSSGVETREEGREAKRIHLNLQGLSAISRETILIMRRNPDLSPSEAEARAKTKLGVSQPGNSTAAPAAGTQGQQQQEATAPVQTLEDTQKQITEARKALREATKAMQFETQAELQDKLFDLQQQEFRLTREADTKASRAQQEFHTTVDVSQRKALELYPDVAKADSPLVRRMEEIDADLQDSGNPLFDSPDKYLKIAQMAANDLGVAPKSKKAASTVAAVKPQGQVQLPARPAAGTTSRATQPPPISGGGARTTQSNAAQTLNEVLDKVTSLDDYEALKRELPRR